MWPRLHIDDVRSVVNTLGTIVIAIAFAMIIPLVIALICREWSSAIAFFISFGITFVLGSAMRLVHPHHRGLTRSQALIVTGLAWVVAALVSAIPFVMTGYSASPLDAFFDAISYYTGTGITLIQDLAHLPISFEIWRVIMVIIGAQGIILVALGLGTISRFSGAGLLFEAEGHQDQMMPRVAATSRFTIGFMGSFIVLGTLLCTILCSTLCGMEPGRALFHGFYLATCAITTGGISAMDIGVGYYQQPVLYILLMCLMFTAVFSFAVYLYMARRGPREFFRDIETRMILIWALIVLIVLAAAFVQDGYFGDLGTFLNKGLFNFVSAITDTGYCTLTSTQLTSVASSGVLFAFILAMSMGGATSSTAGGIKAIRVALVFKSIGAEIRRVLLPSSAHETIRYYHLGEQTLTHDASRNAMLVFLLFLLTYLLGGMAGVLYGADPLDAMLESISCTNNCGISSGLISPELPAMLKVIYFLQMLAGRLEFMTLLATITSIAVSIGRSVGASPMGQTVARAIPEQVRRPNRDQKGDR